MKTTTQPKAQNIIKKQNASKLCRPRRPLNAYNMFFAIERNNIIRKQQEGDFIADERVSSSSGIERAHVGFANLARIVSERWKLIEPNLKDALQEKARLDRIRYQREMKEWKLLQKMNQEFDSMKTQAKLDIERMKQKNNLFDPTIPWIRQVSDDKIFSTDCHSPVASKKEAIAFFRETSYLPYVQPQDRGALCKKEAFEIVNGANALSFVHHKGRDSAAAPELYCVPCCSSSALYDTEVTANDLRGTFNAGVKTTSFGYNRSPPRTDVFIPFSSDPFCLAWSPGPACVPPAAISAEIMKTSPLWNDQCHNCDVSLPQGVGRSIYGLDGFH